MTGIEIARYSEARALDLAVDAALDGRPSAVGLLAVWAEVQTDAAMVELLAAEARVPGDVPELEPSPATPATSLEVTALDRVLDARAVGDLACEAARAHVLGWWLDRIASPPLVGETVATVLVRALRAPAPREGQAAGETVRWMLESAGLLPLGSRP